MSHLIEPVIPYNCIIFKSEYQVFQTLLLHPSNFYLRKRLIWKDDAIHNVIAICRFLVLIEINFIPSTIVKSNSFQNMMKLDEYRFRYT